MGNHHRKPVVACKLVDQHTRGSDKRCAQDQETNSHEDACTSHWLSPVCIHMQKCHLIAEFATAVEALSFIDWGECRDWQGVWPSFLATLCSPCRFLVYDVL